MKVAWAAIVAFLLLLTSGISHAKGRPACTEVRREFASKKVGPLKLVPYRAIQSECFFDSFYSALSKDTFIKDSSFTSNMY